MDIYKIILYFHVACGAVTLLTGGLDLVSTKGGKLHIVSGKVFYWAMFAVTLSALTLAFIKFNPFLLSLAVFSLYMTVSGRRALFYYRLREAFTPAWMDKLPVYIGLLTALFMIIYSLIMGVVLHHKGVIVLLVFGAIMLLNVYNDLKIFKKHPIFKPSENSWIIKHIGMMMGAFIASTTAFLVNAVQFDPAWVLWLSPTAVGTFFIVYYTRKWKTPATKS